VSVRALPTEVSVGSVHSFITVSQQTNSTLVTSSSSVLSESFKMKPTFSTVTLLCEVKEKFIKTTLFEFFDTSEVTGPLKAIVILPASTVVSVVSKLETNSSIYESVLDEPLELSIARE